jgi:hypothetical protein
MTKFKQTVTIDRASAGLRMNLWNRASPAWIEHPLAPSSPRLTGLRAYSLIWLLRIHRQVDLRRGTVEVRCPGLVPISRLIGTNPLSLRA